MSHETRHRWTGQGVTICLLERLRQKFDLTKELREFLQHERVHWLELRGAVEMVLERLG
jgi:hypothetical protein